MAVVYLSGMYIRSIKVANGKTKKQYTYLNLVENIRTDKGPRQRIILNLGKLDIDSSQYKALSKRIENILSGTRELFDLDEDIEKIAQQVSDRIFTKRAKDAQLKAQAQANFVAVDVNSLETKKVRSLGPEYVCHQQWKELEMDRVLRKCGVPKGTIPLLEALIVGRMIKPASERFTRQWAEKHSALFELCGLPHSSSLNAYYRAADVLYRCKDELEKHLACKEQDLFSLDESIVLYDLTNTYFEGQCKKNPKASYGRSKEKRSDCKLATLGLVVDADGFPKYSKFHPGNQCESKTFQATILDLEANAGLKVGATVVMDAGIATKENIEWLKKRKCTYLVVHRGKSPLELEPSQEMNLVMEDKKTGAKIEVFGKTISDEHWVLVKSEHKRLKEEAMAMRTETILLERLQYLRDGLNKKNRMKLYSSVLQSIGRLKEKYPKAAKLYEISVIPGEPAKRTGKLNAIDIKWEKKTQTGNSEGTYTLRTNRKDLDDKNIWELYIMLGRIENSFRDMKSHLGFRPNFHQLEERVQSHMFISVLAYHLMHATECKLRKGGDTRSWKTIKEVLSTHQRITIEYISKTEEGVLMNNEVRLDSRQELEHQKIYAMLGLSGKALNRRMTTHQIRSVNKK